MTPPLPEKNTLRIGIMPLTDCAPLVMASELGLDRKHGVVFELQRQASWANVRDKLSSGELDMAQLLYGMAYGMQLGLGSQAVDMAVLMTLNRNGQGISLSRQLAGRGAVDLASLAALLRQDASPLTFAHTFPTGTHAMWLYYWLAAGGIHPLRDVRSIVVAPPLMVSAAAEGRMHGFSVGEPWNHRGIRDGVSVHAAASQDIWPDHPEKVLGTTAAWADAHPASARAAMRAVLEACAWLDAREANRRLTAEVLSRPAFIDTPVEAIGERIFGRYQDGRGRRWQDPHALAFHGDGAVNFPYWSDGMWFLTQFKRWGLLREHPDYQALARRVHRTALYAEAAAALGVAVPASPLRSSVLIDGVIWDGQNPAAYADGFALRA